MGTYFTFWICIFVLISIFSADDLDNLDDLLKEVELSTGKANAKAGAAKKGKGKLIIRITQLQ